jgi:hypothetical protein
MKSYPRLPAGAKHREEAQRGSTERKHRKEAQRGSTERKHREEARIENWLSMPMTLALILPAEQCDILRLA